MHSSDVVHFYPKPITVRFQYGLCFLVFISVGIGLGYFMFAYKPLLRGFWILFVLSLIAFCLLTFGLSVFHIIGQPCVSVSSQGLSLRTGFKKKFHSWSSLGGKFRLEKWYNGYALTVEQGGSYSLAVPLCMLKKEDQIAVLNLAVRHMQPHDRSAATDELRCFRCLAQIPTGMGACPQCGWSWEQEQPP
jgi:hypothetical protein